MQAKIEQESQKTSPVLTSDVRIKMGRRSKAVKSQTQNLGHPPKNEKTPVNDITDSGDEDSNLLANQPSTNGDVLIGKDNYGFILFKDYKSDDDVPGPSDFEEPDNSDHEDECH